MGDDLNVVVRDLSPVRVAALVYAAEGMAGEYSASIRMLFREVEGWPG